MRNVRYKVVKQDNSSCLVLDNKYRIFYNDGEIAVAPKGTLGCMVFDSEEAARTFTRLFPKPPLFKIKRVIGIGKGIKPLGVGSYVNKLDVFYLKYERLQPQQLSPVPEGTVCYKSVKVLGDLYSFGEKQDEIEGKPNGIKN